ncbi:hypothetical protein HYX13_04460 [Candidatus Woesearchaeota archaeon]|nr:hypothetical protein [Candidatus Woesearchaeota archaeon]
MDTIDEIIAIVGIGIGAYCLSNLTEEIEKLRKSPPPVVQLQLPVSQLQLIEEGVVLDSKDLMLSYEGNGFRCVYMPNSAQQQLYCTTSYDKDNTNLFKLK